MQSLVGDSHGAGIPDVVVVDTAPAQPLPGVCRLRPVEEASPLPYSPVFLPLQSQGPSPSEELSPGSSDVRCQDVEGSRASEGHGAPLEESCEDSWVWPPFPWLGALAVLLLLRPTLGGRLGAQPPCAWGMAGRPGCGVGRGPGSAPPSGCSLSGSPSPGH